MVAIVINLLYQVTPLTATVTATATATAVVVTEHLRAAEVEVGQTTVGAGQIPEDLTHDPVVEVVVMEVGGEEVVEIICAINSKQGHAHVAVTADSPTGTELLEVEEVEGNMAEVRD